MNQPPQQYSAPAPNSTMSIVSLIAGIAGFTLFPVVGSIVAVITGHMAKKEIRESNGAISGDGMATVGLVLGYGGVGLGLLGACCFVLVFLTPFLTIPFFSTTSMLPVLSLFV